MSLRKELPAGEMGSVGKWPLPGQWSACNAPGEPLFIVIPDYDTDNGWKKTGRVEDLNGPALE